MKRRTMNVEVRVGESLRLDGAGQTTVTLEHKSGQRARLRVEADENVQIHPPGGAATIASYLAGQEHQKLA